MYPQSLEEVRQFYLEFPYIKEDNGSRFYEHAARQLEIVMKIAEGTKNTCAGMKGLDLGGGFGWAAYRFALAGAEMTLADYNDSTPSGMGGAQVFADAGVIFDRVRVDAEALPFADDQFDFVFCCSFLHHLTDPAKAIAHIGRSLKTGGRFFAIMEAFCPFWSSRESALSNAHNIEHFTGNGINEQVFYHREYERWFRNAGLNFDVINPRWDAVEDCGKVFKNQLLQAEDFLPECLANRKDRQGYGGLAARLMLKSRAWKFAARPKIFRFGREILLSGSQKLRILIGEKN